MKDREREMVGGSSCSNTSLIKVGVFPSETIVYVNDTEGEVIFLREKKQDIQKAEAVWSARNRDNKGFFMAPELIPSNGI